jgi:N-acetylglucosaminyldiphosphoundecaprenol N-acetyl-beta-D-mannosaminyltransferase
MLDQIRETEARTGRLPYRLKRRPEERVELLGGVMDLVKPAEVLHFAHARIAAKEKAIVANHNLHSLYLLRRDEALRAFYRKSDLIEVDSIPLIAWARLVGRPSRRFHRCTYLDWRGDFWSWAQQNGLRVFFVGGRPGVADTAATKIRAEWPGLELQTHHGYFDVQPGSAENDAVVQAIADFAPDILLVGMGMPIQETWILRNHDALPSCVMFTVGGAFDYEAGVHLTCPRWAGQLGLEWLFRLATNPALFHRYAVEPWSLVVPAIKDLVRSAGYRLSAVRRGRTATDRGTVEGRQETT